MSRAYYNEIDPFAAAWLRELIKAGLIANGEVDERDIREVQAADLRGFTQCHFFAGIGVWSHALRAAGWADDTPVWTGSCPCQGFSASGKRGGFSDQRHLWPAWFRLIRECAPHVVFGEQVSSRDGLAWFDLVSADLEGAGYAVGALDTCAAGVGAPHIRQRLYFSAARKLIGKEVRCGCWDKDAWHRKYGTWPWERCGNFARTSDANKPRLSARVQAGIPGHVSQKSPSAWREFERVHATNTWREWDAQSAIRVFAYGAPARVGRLRGYGNALVAPQAEAFIRAYREAGRLE